MQLQSFGNDNPTDAFGNLTMVNPLQEWALYNLATLGDLIFYNAAPSVRQLSETKFNSVEG